VRDLWAVTAGRDRLEGLGKQTSILPEWLALSPQSAAAERWESTAVGPYASVAAFQCPRVEIRRCPTV